MSVPEREEERRKNTCSSSGLGLAAAAIGVGVGAALYYFLSRRPEENRASGPSSSENWSYEQPQTFNYGNDESYSTFSEHTTSNTSINDSLQEASYSEDSETGIDTSDDDTNGISNSSYASDSEVSFTDSKDCSLETGYNTLWILTNAQNSTVNSDSDFDWDVTDSALGVPDVYPRSILDTIKHQVVQVFSPNVINNHDNDESYSTFSEHTTTDTSINDSLQEASYSEDSETGIDTSDDDTSGISDSSYASDSEVSFTDSEDSSLETGYNTLWILTNAQNSTVNSDSDIDWDVTDSSLGVPEVYPRSILDTITHQVVQVFSPNVINRERSWTLEECSICFEVMLREQDLLSLPCTHRFHVACIGPWLQERQTCPNCRKAAE